MNVKEMMSRSVYFVTADATVNDAVDLMKKYNIGLVPICDNRGCLLGVITDRDILLRTAYTLPSKPPASILLSEIMSENIVTISPEISIHSAASIFAKSRLHRLPVTENSRLVGILSVTDLAKKRVYLAEAGEIIGAIAKGAGNM